MPDFNYPGDKPPIETATFEQIVVPSSAGVQEYFTPTGSYFFDGTGETALERDTGAGFVPQVFGVDYTHRARAATSCPASVIDAAIGFTFIPAVLAGWTFRFRWKVKTVLVEPYPVTKAKVSAGVIDNSVTWKANTADAPNGILVPPLSGYQLEFWRQTRHPGGLPGFGTRPRGGRRYMPYYRAAVGQFAVGIDEFAPVAAKNRWQYRVCYYNPLSKARSLMSRDKIVVCSGTSDAVNGRSPVRTARSVWIE
jgi:hypothetical protein